MTQTTSGVPVPRRRVAAVAPRPPTRVVSVINFKGGSGKSTTAAYLAHALRRRGYRVTGVDADPPGSLVEWAGLGEWDIPVVGLAVPTLHKQLWGIIDQDRTDVVMLDTPPLEEKAGIVMAALRVATDIIVPMAPTLMEVHRTAPVWPAIEDTVALADVEPNVWVLLNRTVSQANSTEQIREQLTDEGHRVLRATIPRLERYAQSFGGPVDEPEGSPYDLAAAQIVEVWS